eukprot:CAMPEP_0182442798 /NCGR_PEP_ID=MMETSP1172-20130603/1668_1 /TAXON_ID=708627 /ORGANISM="Timspurckia oligopyrenoides, Strain CCMP3278" /LENGTH=165 /DNA_ID=CAMNT_0024637829 /DNA_START=376 /DNA_END=873 /DNA_ORIENTATION=-
MRPSSNAQRVSIQNLLNSVEDEVSVSSGKESVLCKHRSGSTITQERTRKQKRFNRRLWTREEDTLLESLVKQFGAKGWKKLALHFENRTSGQLRARWAHSLSCKDTKRAFSEEEDVYILLAHQKYGNSWAMIARGMPNRCDNTVKNRFRALQNKERKIKSNEARV